jgi:enolase
MKITQINSQEILDSRGNPTIETKVTASNGQETLSAVASVPSGASTGDFEAYELRDGDKSRFGGKGVLQAIKNVEKVIFPVILGMDVTKQFEIDQKMLDLDGTDNKSNLGANAILSVSMAVARLGALSSDTPLYSYIAKMSENTASVPRAYFNIINGGMHAGNKIAFQEFMISPNLVNFTDNYRAAAEIYQTLKKDLTKKFGGVATLLGDEGGYAPNDFKQAGDALDIIIYAIDEAGYTGKVDIAMDIAASEFYNTKTEKYDLGFKMTSGEKDQFSLTHEKSATEMTEYYMELIEKYPIISIEDPFDQSDFRSFAILLEKVENRGVQIVADDLTVTNPKRIQKAIDSKSADALLLKINQIGTISEALKSAKLARSDG